MTKQKKQTIILTVLILLMVGMGFCYMVLRKISQVKEAEANQSIELYKLDTKKTEEITIENENGEMVFTKTNGKWTLKADADFPVNKDKIEEILNAMKTVEANSQVTDGTEELSQYGLEKPVCSILVKLNNGVKAKVSFGSQVPVLGGYYVLVDDETKVYTMSDSLYQTIQTKKMDFVKMESIPSIETEQVNRITIAEKGKKDISVVKKKDGSYIWNGAYKDTVAGNSEKVIDFISNYTGLVFDSCAEYNCSDFGTYGLKNPKNSILISYNTEKGEKEKEYRLNIGRKNENGSYYVSSDNSAFVYEISADTIDELLHVNAFDYIEQTIFAFAADTLQSFTIEKEDGTKKSLNIEKDLDTLSSIQALTYSGEAKKDKTDNTKIYKCVVQNDKKTSTITFLPYDKTNYRVNKDGQELFLANKKAVDNLFKK